VKKKRIRNPKTNPFRSITISQSVYEAMVMVAKQRGVTMDTLVRAMHDAEAVRA
jgi:hypothetical protein